MAPVDRLAATNHAERQDVKATLRWIVSNSPLMVLALILATLAWMPPEGMTIVGEFEESVQFTVRAPESVWSTLEAKDFVATVDLTDLNAGTHQASVEWALSKRPSQVLSVEPEYVTLRLEPRAEQTVPVHVETDGKPTLGYLTRTLTITPSQVTVSGPSTYVAQVVKAAARVSVQDASADVEGEFQHSRALSRPSR